MIGRGYTRVSVVIFVGLVLICPTISSSVSSRDWVSEILATACYSGGEVSITVGANDTIHIAHYNNSGVLEYIKKSYDTWTTEVVDPERDVGGFPSIQLDKLGNPHICYYDYTNARLKYASWTGFIWDIEIVASGNVGLYCSLALTETNQPCIAYFDQENTSLDYAWKDGASWMKEIVDGVGCVGVHCDLAMDCAGEPYISYKDFDNQTIMCAFRESNGWQIEYVDSCRGKDGGPSIAIGPDGTPTLAYYSGGFPGDVRVARRVDGVWTNTIIDPASGGYASPDVTIDLQNRVHIVYVDWTDRTLNYAKNVEEGWLFDVVMTDCLIYDKSAITLDGKANPHICFHDRARLRYTTIVPTPSYPRNLSVNVGDRYVNVTWSCPSEDCDHPILGYTIYRSESLSDDLNLTIFPLGLEYYFNDTNVIPRHTYFYKICAFNDAGHGANSTNVNVNAISRPNAPTNLSLTVENGLIILSWKRPKDDGGSPIEYYIVERVDSTGNSMVIAYNEEFYDSNIQNGVNYVYAIRAVNNAGASISSQNISGLAIVEHRQYSVIFSILVITLILVIILVAIAIRMLGKR